MLTMFGSVNRMLICLQFKKGGKELMFKLKIVMGREYRIVFGFWKCHSQNYIYHHYTLDTNQKQILHHTASFHQSSWSWHKKNLKSRWNESPPNAAWKRWWVLTKNFSNIYFEKWKLLFISWISVAFLKV